MLTGPKLTQRHKLKRLEFAKLHMGTDWLQNIFSDGEKFNLHGPEGFNGYWRNLRKGPQFFSQRNLGGGSLMTWGAFAADGVLDLQFVPTKKADSCYFHVLECSLLPYLR